MMSRGKRENVPIHLLSNHRPVVLHLESVLGLRRYTMPAQSPIAGSGGDPDEGSRANRIPEIQSTGWISGVEGVPNVDAGGVSQVPLGTFTTPIP